MCAGGFEARYLAAADGLHSPIRKAMGLSAATTGARRWGIRRHYEIAPWTNSVEVHWSRNAEAYVTPVADDCVGIAILSAGRGGFDRHFESFGELRDRVAGHAHGQDRAAGRCGRTFVAGRRVECCWSVMRPATSTRSPVKAWGWRSVRPSCWWTASLRDCPDDYDRQWRRLTRRYRMLTAALVQASAHMPVRSAIVPAAQALAERLQPSCESPCALRARWLRHAGSRPPAAGRPAAPGCTGPPSRRRSPCPRSAFRAGHRRGSRPAAGCASSDRTNVGGDALGKVLAGRLVGVGGQVVQLGRRGVIGCLPHHVRVDLQTARAQHAAQHDDERAVGLGHLGRGGRRDEVGRQVGRRRELQQLSRVRRGRAAAARSSRPARRRARAAPVRGGRRLHPSPRSGGARSRDRPAA